MGEQCLTSRGKTRRGKTHQKIDGTELGQTDKKWALIRFLPFSQVCFFSFPLDCLGW